MLELITEQLYFLCTQESRRTQFTTALPLPEDNEVPVVPEFLSILHMTLLPYVQDLKMLEVLLTQK